MTSSEFRGDLDPITSFLIRERYRDSDKGKTEFRVVLLQAKKY